MAFVCLVQHVLCCVNNCIPSNNLSNNKQQARHRQSPRVTRSPAAVYISTIHSMVFSGLLTIVSAA
jgi:hypothetical protein